MSSEDVCEVVITAPAGPWLPDFVRQLVEDRLCASGHVAPMHSTYRWKGVIHDAAEDRAALHTRTALLPEVIERVLAEHPYEVPCVVAVPIVDGSPAYLQWIRDETRSPSISHSPAAGS